MVRTDDNHNDLYIKVSLFIDSMGAVGDRTLNAPPHGLSWIESQGGLGCAFRRKTEDMPMQCDSSLNCKVKGRSLLNPLE